MAEYGKWDGDKLPVLKNGKEVGYLTEDADGWAYWEKAVIGHQLIRVAKTKNAALDSPVSNSNPSDTQSPV